MKRIFTDIQDFGDDSDSDEKHEKEAGEKFKRKTGAVIFLVDAREKMFIKTKEFKQPFVSCLECVRNAIRNKIFSVEKCFCSILLLGTKKYENSIDLNNICIIQEFKLLGAEHIMKIDEILKGVKNSTHEKEYGYGKFSMGDALWLSCYTFQQKSGNLKKSIIYFTNDDEPPSNESNDESRAVASAQDMFKSYITFDLIHLGKGFDVNKFYKKILVAASNNSKLIIPNPVEKEDEMLQRVSKTNFRHVTLVKMPFVISKDFEISVSVHFLVKKAKLPFKIKLSRSTNERVVSKLQYFETETGSVVKKQDLIKSQNISQKDITFSPYELKLISERGKVELRLLGFKPASCLRLENYVKHCAFVYPDDSSCKGSSVFFTALMKRCIAKQVVPICTFSPRVTSACRFVALMAQDEVLREDKIQELPPGFVVFFLPFAEEVRAIEDKVTKRASPEAVDLAVKLIKKLKFNYKVDSFENPKIKTHWAAIEALALDLSETEEVIDGTVPNYELISHRTGEIAKEFLEEVYPEDYDPEEFSAPKKPKTTKTTKTTTTADLDNVEEMIKEGRGVQLSNDVLKKYLISIGEGKKLSKLKKSELLEKIETHLGLN